MSPALFSLVIAAAILVGFGAVAAFVVLLADAQSARRVRQRLGLADEVADDFDGADRSKLVQRIARRGQSLERIVDKEGETPLLLAQAGWRTTQARLTFYLFQGLIPVALTLLLIAGWLSGNHYFKAPSLYLMMFAAFALSLLIPRWVLRSAASGRRMRIRREVPLFAHLLVLLFEAGLSTRQALASLVREGHGVLPELGREFDSVIRQLDTGADTGEVLRQLGETLAVDDLTTILGVLRQVDRYGGEIREPLLEMLKILEERRGLDLRERVNLISGRMTIVMVLFFFPALLIFVGGPAAIAVTRTLSHAAGQ